MDDGDSIGRARGPAAVLFLALLMGVTLAAQEIPVPNGGFESGLAKPWGTGQLGGAPELWRNSAGCRSTAAGDPNSKHGGALSLHVVHASPRAPNVYGTTQQPVAVPAGRRIRITLFARARDLKSNGAVSIVVDPQWRTRPIQLPKGTYDWTRFTGEFTSPAAVADLRILSEDVGEAWIDDLRAGRRRDAGSPAERAREP